jgi:hypothetical protein
MALISIIYENFAFHSIEVKETRKVLAKNIQTLSSTVSLSGENLHLKT